MKPSDNEDQSAKDFVGWPITPGFELAGIVKKTGDKVTQFLSGQSGKTVGKLVLV